MRYIKQLLLILAITCIGEILKYFIPLPIPASIYGLVIMFICLAAGIIKLDQVRETAEFLVEIMAIMFIPPAVGLISSWDQLSSVLVPFAVITVLSTFIVMIITGKTADFLLSRKKGGSADE